MGHRAGRGFPLLFFAPMKRICLTLFLVLGAAAAQHALAQLPPNGGPQPGAGPDPTPIDGGASLLLASGAAYALKRLRQRRRPA